eukprot:CAMPEP_0114655184 /NCGR_PEP_ID=MMETSP0191-20121206/10935_1 /TAXON_ID=126664 /ORGANISM="Sorites sp." /LENGTH=423 /DNA_ID=CAMNT_0001870835 /DNA_START=412 /DNA_END=1683 /DNA_ORIENTATION=+
MNDFLAPKDQCTNGGSDCDLPIFGWAVGADEFVFPQEVGLPFSADPNDPQRTQYVRLEMHYDNPNNIVGAQDYSGLTIYYTDNLRQYDGSMIQLGHVVYDSMFVPNGIETTVYGVCDSSCTDNFGVNSVTAIASFLHSHTIGVQLRLRHFRGNTELAPIDENLNYDFDFQQFVPINRTIQAGDSMLTECYYDSRSRDEITLAGEATTEEMCLAFLMVYPAPNVATCESAKFNAYDADGGQNPRFKWLNEANSKGYVVDPGTMKVLNMSKPGAIELYNQYTIDTSNTYYETVSRCLGSHSNNQFYPIDISPFFSGFIPYNETDPECSIIPTKDQTPSTTPTLTPSLTPSTTPVVSPTLSPTKPGETRTPSGTPSMSPSINPTITGQTLNPSQTPSKRFNNNSNANDIYVRVSYLVMFLLIIFCN